MFSLIYALDIGTRTVIGVLAEKIDEKIVVYDSEIMEHEERAMSDGAIQDVQKVSQIVKRVTRTLSERNQIELTKASVAVAGRFLKTSIGEAELNVEEERAISSDTIRLLEMNAIQASMEQLRSDGREMYCVGYSVLFYTLDGEWIKNLQGHRGKVVTVKVIAAFLPAYFVNAMMNVLELSGLTPQHMTLEPIAAINLVVPPDLRKLNIVLADVGAGTSDIAVSRDGTVIAYSVVPMAGDEITESLCERFLLDFQTAEMVKRRISTEDVDTVTVYDILDTEVNITREVFIETVAPVIEEITQKIADETIELNGKPPVAALIVGGGAKSFSFVDVLGKKLNLSSHRAALKSIENLPNVEDRSGKLRGSEYITPVGIAYSVDTHTSSVFVRVSINGKSVDLMGIDNKNTVMQALLQCGYRIEEIIGKPGPALTYELNGEVKIVKGTMGQEASIKIEGETGRVQSRLKHGDSVSFKPGKEGKSPELFLSSVVPPIPLVLNGNKISLMPRVTINGNELTGDVQIKDGDRIETDFLCRAYQIPEYVSDREKKYLSIILNGMIRTFVVREEEVLVGEQLVDSDYVLKPGDQVRVQVFEKTPVVRNLIKDIPVKVVTVLANGKETQLPVTVFNVRIDGTIANLDSPLYDKAEVQVDTIEKIPKLIDLFSLLEFDLSHARSYELRVNGKHASFMETIEDGDEIEILLNRGEGFGSIDRHAQSGSR
ncbi:MAG TPA: cell division FtsA domain-containing protein [Thermotogota bacterium]|nr:cell division FtsA domain-containing protein [Thermotogota bacterium]